MRYWQNIQFDLPPLPGSNWCNKHLLVVVDYCSKWVEAFPLRVAKTPQIAAILIKDLHLMGHPCLSCVGSRGKVHIAGLEYNMQAVGSHPKTDHSIPPPDKPN